MKCTPKRHTGSFQMKPSDFLAFCTPPQIDLIFTIWVDTIENIAPTKFQLPTSTHLWLAAPQIFQDFSAWPAHFWLCESQLTLNKHKTHKLHDIVLKLGDLYLWAMRSLKITLKMLSNGRVYLHLVNKMLPWSQEILGLLAFLCQKCLMSPTRYRGSLHTM